MRVAERMWMIREKEWALKDIKYYIYSLSHDEVKQ
jgi:hypothetical protein